MSKLVSEDEKLNRDTIEDEQIVEADESQSLADEEQVLEVEKPAVFFHVGITKFAIMFVATLGMYQIYWFYKQWDGVRDFYKLKVWPAPRAIFAIFFTHSLFTYVNEYIKEDEREYVWSPRNSATMYVALVVLAAVLGQVYGKLSTSILIGLASVLLTVLSLIPLYKAQEAINFALQGSHYEENSKLTIANWPWIILGGCYWLFVSLGIYASLVT